jgi:hypothetical protein
MKESCDRFLQETLEFWQARTKRVLTLEDAREIAENIGAFFEILIRPEQEAQPSSPAREVS